MKRIELTRNTGTVVYWREVGDDAPQPTRIVLELAHRAVVDLRDLNLAGADLRDAQLPGIDLRDSDLRRADLRGANLRNADLRGANLMGADRTGADLTGARLYYHDPEPEGLS